MSRSVGALLALATIALATTALVAGSAAAHPNAPGGPGGGHGVFDPRWPGRVGRFHGRGGVFVQQTGPELRLHGKPFRFAGTNNYYLIYKSQLMVDDVLNTAAAQGFDVVRTWGFMDQSKEGVQFQSFDVAAGKPVVDEGAAGLEHLDYVIAKADQLGLKLVIPFTNNWSDFGGMDQYVQWLVAKTGDTSLLHHDTFYTDPTIKQWYKAYISTLLNHVNVYTGVKYKDDPTIMTWELGNEPRCKGSGALPPTASCNTHTLIRWADEMSRYIKSIDRNHLVSVGDEGFYCTNPSDPDWTRNCGEGVDTVAFARLPAIDVMSFHLYPDSWGKADDPQWSIDWIKSHFAVARAVGKPAMLGEFGLLDATSQRNPTYKTWLDTVLRSDGAGALYWILSGKQDDGTLYPDYDHYTVYCPSPVCTTIDNFTQETHAGHELVFPPVADDNSVTTDYATPITINASANDIAYGHASIVSGSLDLDPSTAGQQTSATAVGGTFISNGDGTVTFTPADGFSGKASAQYVIKDSANRSSNVATLAVTVKPNPNGLLRIASYEDGLDGAAGTVAQSSDWASDGTSSLKITVATDGWYQIAQFATPVDLTGKSALLVDLHTLGDQTYRKLSIQLGDSWAWCEGGSDGNTPPNSTGVVTFDLTNMTCGAGDLTKLQQVNIYLQPGTFYVDYIRAN